MRAVRAAASSGDTWGRRYNSSHGAIQRKPINPVRTKAHLQPQFRAIQGTISGPMIAPTLDPELNSPVASARSLLGNHSATVLIAAGKLPASPSPNAKRAAPKANAVRARAWHIAATLQ